MTIASEISRLQTDKEAMRQAIIEKGVDVAASVSFDDYAACILAIQTPPKISYIDYLMVGGGGGGGRNPSGSSCYLGGGGGAGGVIECFCDAREAGSYNIVIGGGGGTDGHGGDTCFGELIAYGGGSGVDGYNRGYSSPDGASGGGGASCVAYGSNGPGSAIHGTQGHNGGNGHGSYSYFYGGGGGGAGGDGCNGGYTSVGWTGGDGGIGIQSCMSGELCYYAGGGGGGGGSAGGNGQGGLGGGGNGGGGNATYYGGGGGGNPQGRSTNGGCGYQGIVIIRYKTDGSCGISDATGGCKYTCGDYTIHCFTTDGTFTIVS